MELTPEEIEYVLKRESRVFISDEEKYSFKSVEERDRIINIWIFNNPFEKNTVTFNTTISLMKQSNERGGLKKEEVQWTND